MESSKNQATASQVNFYLRLKTKRLECDVQQSIGSRCLRSEVDNCIQHRQRLRLGRQEFIIKLPNNAHQRSNYLPVSGERPRESAKRCGAVGSKAKELGLRTVGVLHGVAVFR